MSNIQLSNIHIPYELRKIVIDYRNLPICTSHIEDTGFLRKRYVYYHNYGTYVQITIITIPMFGEPKIITYHYSVAKKHRQSLPRKAHRPITDSRQYIA